MHHYMLTLSILMLFFGTVHADPVTIDNINIAVNIDGHLDESVWSNVTKYTGFYNHFPTDQGLSENQTEVQMYHDGKMLYIGAVYYDQTTEKNIASLKRDNYQSGVFLSDCFGVALDPNNQGDTGYMFALNAGGVQYDALIGNANDLNSSWNAIWTSKVRQKDNRKIYEMAIPLEALNFKSGDQSWGIQFFVNDVKINLFSTLVQSPRNFVQYDLRYTQEVMIEDLPKKTTNKFSFLPSLSANYQKDQVARIQNSNWTPSLDAKYNINSSLKLDVTLNPDFSQVEVDQQVTNLSRFAINFPERRRFFVENSDLFNNLGTWTVDPFYSRRIGAQSDILFGTKLSGNISKRTRIGILNTQTKSTDDIDGSNYTAAVGRYNFSDNFNGSAYVLNTSRPGYNNLILGSNLNFRSTNRKWSGSTKYGKALTSNLDGKNNYFNGTIEYDTPELIIVMDVENVGENYFAETGFIPFQNIFDAAAQQTVREQYTKVDAGFQIRKYKNDSDVIDWTRRIWVRNTTVLNADQSVRSNTVFWSPFAIRFMNSSYVYLSSATTVDNPRYSFDFLQNGNLITPGRYVNSFVRGGYWSASNKAVSYRLRMEYATFYGGTRVNPEIELSYRLLPIAVVSAGYESNKIEINELGQKTFHLAKLTSEIYFSNQLNWTTYLQYNTQANNLNVNSRLQWEYEPLSFVYLVLTNNYNNDLVSKNWGFSLKINRRIDM